MKLCVVMIENLFYNMSKSIYYNLTYYLFISLCMSTTVKK